MKILKKIVTLVLIASLTMSTGISAFADGEEKYTENSVAVVQNETEGQSVTAVKMKSVAYMKVGAVAEMLPTLTVSPDNATNKAVEWESSNENIAVVDENGIVEAKQTGRCVIVARSKDNVSKQATCSVVVSQSVESVALSSKSVVINNGESRKLTATVMPANASEKCVTWQSSNNNVASVSATGVVTAKGAGTCVIKAVSTDNAEKFGYCSVMVTQKATGLAVVNAPEQLGVGEKTTLNTIITPSYATTKSVKYTSSNNSVATVSARGVVTAVKKGQCKITATTTDGSNISTTFDLKVIIPMQDITLSDESRNIIEGTSSKLKATVTPSNATKKALTYLSSNTNIATVSADGTILARNKGTCKIYISSNDGSNIRKCYVVNVIRPVESVALENNDITLNAEDTCLLKASVLPISATDTTVTYISSDTSVASVDENGIVTATGKGNCTITCLANGDSEKYDVCSVTVKQPVKGLKLIGNETIKEGETTILTATVSPMNADNKELTWKSSDTSVATVDKKGNIKGVSAGTVTITCTAKENNKFTASLTITVKPVKTKGELIVDYASKWVGVTPYVWGGTSLTYGADCSGFVCSVYQNFGYNLWYARTNLDMVGKAVSLSEAKPGDIVLFPGHVAIYAGNGYITHAMNESLGVRTTPLSWGGYVRCIRRVV